jgi:HSP20 family protein
MEVSTMLMRTDSFRDLDRIRQQVFGNGTSARPVAMPMEAWRHGDTLVIEFDLPGVSPESIGLDVERNVITVQAERSGADGDIEMVAAERPRGVFSRQLVLGDNLDTNAIDATYEAGVLTVRIPVAERARPRRIEIARGDDSRKAINA